MRHEPSSSLYRRNNTTSGLGESTAPGSQQLPHRSAHEEVAEEENEALMRALLDDVKQLKRKHTIIGAEVKRQNALLDVLGGAFAGAQAGLRRTMRHLDRIGWGSFKHMWILFVFVVVVLVFIVAALKMLR